MSTSKTAETIRTARLTLRGPRQTDLAAMHRVYANPEAMRYWSTLPHESPNVTQELLDRVSDAWAERQTNFQIERDGIWIGNVGMFARNEIGFMLDPALHRQGYISEALDVVVPLLFERTPHDHLMADIDPRNVASAGILRKFGFRETHRAERTYFIGGVWFDSAYYRLDRPT